MYSIANYLLREVRFQKRGTICQQLPFGLSFGEEGRHGHILSDFLKKSAFP